MAGKVLNISRDVLLETLAFVVTAVTIFSKWTKTTVDDAAAKVLAAVAGNEVLLELLYQILGYSEAWDASPGELPPVETDPAGVLRLVVTPVEEGGTLALVQQSALDSRVEALMTPQHVEALTAAGIGVDVFKAALPILIALLRKRLGK